MNDHVVMRTQVLVYQYRYHDPRNLIGGIIILEFKRFELRETKPLIDKYFEQHHYEASDNCFTTLFMWQDAYGIVGLRKTVYCTSKVAVNVEPFLLPPFAGKDAKFLDGLLRAKEWFVENNLPFRFKGVSKVVKSAWKSYVLVVMNLHLTATTTNTFINLKILSTYLVRSSVKRKPFEPIPHAIF